MAQSKVESVTRLSDRFLIISLDDYGCLDPVVVRHLFHDVYLEMAKNETLPSFELHINPDGTTRRGKEGIHQESVLDHLLNKLALLIDGYMRLGQTSPAYLSYHPYKIVTSTEPLDFKAFFEGSPIKYQTLREALLTVPADSVEMPFESSNVSLLIDFSLKELTVFSDGVFVCNPSISIRYELNLESNYQRSLTNYQEKNGEFPAHYKQLKIMYETYAANMLQHLNEFACPLLQLVKLAHAAGTVFYHQQSVNKQIYLHPIRDHTGIGKDIRDIVELPPSKLPIVKETLSVNEVMLHLEQTLKMDFVQHTLSCSEDGTAMIRVAIKTIWKRRNNQRPVSYEQEQIIDAAVCVLKEKMEAVGKDAVDSLIRLVDEINRCNSVRQNPRTDVLQFNMDELMCRDGWFNCLASLKDYIGTHYALEKRLLQLKTDYSEAQAKLVKDVSALCQIETVCVTSNPRLNNAIKLKMASSSIDVKNESFPYVPPVNTYEEGVIIPLPREKIVSAVFKFSGSPQLFPPAADVKGPTRTVTVKANDIFLKLMETLKTKQKTLPDPTFVSDSVVEQAIRDVLVEAIEALKTQPALAEKIKQGANDVMLDQYEWKIRDATIRYQAMAHRIREENVELLDELIDEANLCRPQNVSPLFTHPNLLKKNWCWLIASSQLECHIKSFPVSDDLRERAKNVDDRCLDNMTKNIHRTYNILWMEIELNNVVTASPSTTEPRPSESGNEEQSSATAAPKEPIKGPGIFFKSSLTARPQDPPLPTSHLHAKDLNDQHNRSQTIRQGKTS